MFFWRKKATPLDPVAEAFKPYFGVNPALAIKRWEERRGRFVGGVIVVVRIFGLEEILSQRDLRLLKNTVDNFYQYTASVISDAGGHLSEFLGEYAFAVFFDSESGTDSDATDSASRAAIELVKGWGKESVGPDSTKSLIAAALDRREFVYDIFGGKLRKSGQAIMADFPKLLRALDDQNLGGHVLIGGGLTKKIAKIEAIAGTVFEPWKGNEWYISRT